MSVCRTDLRARDIDTDTETAGSFIPSRVLPPLPPLHIRAENIGVYPRLGGSNLRILIEFHCDRGILYVFRQPDILATSMTYR